MPYLLVILALVLLVVVHELGHFLAARMVGIRATKFYVFFPPAAWKKQIGDVEYGIGWIPAGGFVKLPGMFEPEPTQVSQRVTWELEQLGTLSAEDTLEADAARRRIAQADGADALVEPIEELVALVERQPDEREQRAAVLRRLHDLQDDLHPRAYWRAALWRRMTVIFAGPLVNLVVAFAVLLVFYMALVPRYETAAPLVAADIAKGSPAAEAGIVEKARIHAWNGKVVGVDPFELDERIFSGRGKPVTITYSNPGDARVTRTIEPRAIDGEGSTKRIGVVLGTSTDGGIEIVGRESNGIGESASATAREMRTITWGNLTRLPQVFFKEEVRSEVSSVVGIVQFAEDVDQAGMSVRYIGIISLVLAVMNLLPLLPLDGGHLLFGIIEAIRRRPLPRMVFERYSMVGLAIVGVLFLIGLNNDIGPSSG